MSPTGGPGRRGRPVDPDDPHQWALYAAEDAAMVGGGRQLGAPGGVRAFVDEVVLDPWWSETFPTAPIDVDVVARSAGATASVCHVAAAGDAAVVMVHPRHRHAVAVVHELAHVAAWGGAAGEAAHGATFGAALLLLWRRHLGAHAYGALRAELDGRGIPYRRDLLDRSRSSP